MHSVTMIVKRGDTCLIGWRIGLRPHLKIGTGKLHFEPFPAQRGPNFLLICVRDSNEHLGRRRWGKRREWELVGPAAGDYNHGSRRNGTLAARNYRMGAERTEWLKPRAAVEAIWGERGY